VKFAVLFEGQLAFPTRANERQLMLDCLDQAILADEMGFDRVWAVEHHALKWYAHMSAPEIFLSFVAARTSRIRVGHGVVCVPFNYNHPVRVAERVATMDILSGGRVDLGVGRGATVQELSTFGIDVEDTLDQMVEAIRMIPGCWGDEDFLYEGELLNVPGRPIIPKPVQDPHPPLYMACSREETLVLAANLGIGALAMGWGGPEDIKVKRKIYDDAIAARDESNIVGKVATNHLAGLSPACVLDDREKARAIGVRGQRFFQDSINHWYTGGPPPEADIEDDDNVAILKEHGEEVLAYIAEHAANMPGQDLIKGGVSRTAAGGYDPNQCYGNVDDAIEHIELMADAGADEIMMCFQMGTVPHEVCMESITNVGKYVIPHFRK
jgi:alkanesulfonate monooxygenase SsuD/methylene tetrahydromethanopterin reductase-like flavin-dependent oxidoreductase (luciferase family)